MVASLMWTVKIYGLGGRARTCDRMKAFNAGIDRKRNRNGD
jgi:hypothetical protein